MNDPVIYMDLFYLFEILLFLYSSQILLSDEWSCNLYRSLLLIWNSFVSLFKPVLTKGIKLFKHEKN